MKKYLLTGCAGFIGSNFVTGMLESRRNILLVNLDKLTYAGSRENLLSVSGDPRYVFVQGDVCDRELVASLFRRYDFDRVIHFAAESHVDRSIQDPDAFVRTNVMGTVNLLTQARAAWLEPGTNQWKPDRRFLQVSTDEVYGTLGADGVFTEDSPAAPRSPYAASKAAADHFVLAHRDTYGMPVNITRCCNNFGPYQYPEKLIPLIIRRARKHLPLPVYGDGMQVRDWLYVLDHCRAVALVSDKGRPGEIYNVGARCERTNLELIRQILKLLREKLGDEGISEALIRHVQDRPGHDRRYAVDPGKITRELGWRPETSFETGLSRTVDWYIAHEAWVERAAGRTEQPDVQREPVS